MAVCSFLIEVEFIGCRLAGRGETRLEPFQFHSQRRRSANNGPLSLRNRVAAPEIADVKSNEVTHPATPC